MMTKHLVAMIAAIAVGILISIWLVMVPPHQTPPHASYLPDRMKH